jgi:hypothetical protein
VILFSISCGPECQWAHLFVIGNLLQVCVEWVWESSGDKLLLGEVLQSVYVELALEVFESESIVENGDVSSWGRVEVFGDWRSSITLFSGSCSNEAERSKDREDVRVTHLE